MERITLDYLRDWFGPHLSRPRAGAARDLGDVAGIPDWTVEIKAMDDLLRAIRDGLSDLKVEQANAATKYGALICKRRGIGDPARHLFVMELGNALPLMGPRK